MHFDDAQDQPPTQAGDSQLPESNSELPFDLDDLPVDFQPIILNPRRGWAKRHQAELAEKKIRFTTPEDVRLARLLEFKARLEGVPINALMLRLLRRGWDAEKDRGAVRHLRDA